MEELMAVPWIFWFYVVGLASVCFHFANGVWGFCVSWGITVGAKAQAWAGAAFAALGLLIFYMGANSLVYLIR
jgi:succinate dehydrogenase/fumarate reductase cytochrome b subunit